MKFTTTVLKTTSEHRVDLLPPHLKVSSSNLKKDEKTMILLNGPYTIKELTWFFLKALLGLSMTDLYPDEAKETLLKLIGFMESVAPFMFAEDGKIIFNQKQELLDEFENSKYYLAEALVDLEQALLWFIPFIKEENDEIISYMMDIVRDYFYLAFNGIDLETTKKLVKRLDKAVKKEDVPEYDSFSVFLIGKYTKDEDGLFWLEKAVNARNKNVFNLIKAAPMADISVIRRLKELAPNRMSEVEPDHFMYDYTWYFPDDGKVRSQIIINWYVEGQVACVYACSNSSPKFEGVLAFYYPQACLCLVEDGKGALIADPREFWQKIEYILNATEESQLA